MTYMWWAVRRECMYMSPLMVILIMYNEVDKKRGGSE
jgi:hypothetical protein